ncbi:MAG TPA: hypothetical protein VGX69_02725 [Solirubrobacteraceae bacterium]|nr:hypothetical protein [Solirubrobacteraceae bacterium]
MSQTTSLQRCPSGGDGPARGLTKRWRGPAIGAAVLVALALPAAAQAAGAPKATTGGARDVSYASATLAGTVNPNGSDTSYYFQYGPTKAYGLQSSIAAAGAGKSGVAVRLPIAGLQPITVYHYRLVAVSASGVSIGSDNTFKTEKVPLSLAIFTSPNPVTFGGLVTIQGTLSGTDNANRAVVLQANTFPFTGAFQSIGNPELTSATGGFSFVVPSLTAATQFRVFTTTSTPVVSPVALEYVAVRVSSHVARTRRRGFARIYGTVTPAANGMQVGILRIEHGRGTLVSGSVLGPLGSSSSQFSRVVRVRKGAYRVLVRVTSGPFVSAYGTTLLIG